MLRLIFVVVLKVNSGANQVERVGDDTAGGIGPEGRQRRHDCGVASPILRVLPLEAEDKRKVVLEQVIDGVEDA